MANEVRMPQLGLTMEIGTINSWKKKEGDTVAVGEVLLEVATDKLTNEVESEFEGTLLKIVAQEGEDVPVQGIMAYIGKPGEVVGDAAPAPAAAPAAPAETPMEGEVGIEGAFLKNLAAKEAPKAEKACNTGRLRISPLARKTAAAKGVDLAFVEGTGPNGRIVNRDILAAAAQPKPLQTAAPAKVGGLPVPSTPVEMMEGDTVVKLVGMRKVVAERMYASHNEIPPVTQNIKVDVTALMKLRKDLLAATGKKFSVNDFILKATAKCLSKHPEMLVSFDGTQIIQRKHVNLGMAVALDNGLIVPVIRDADKMSMDEISDQAKALAKKARDGKLAPEDYKGSTFSISNLGMFGIETFTPIINQPDAAILGVCAIADELAMDDEGKIFKKQVMRLSLTLDHRLLDGAVAAQFEMDLRDLLESPMNILL